MYFTLVRIVVYFVVVFDMTTKYLKAQLLPTSTLSPTAGVLIEKWEGERILNSDEITKIPDRYSCPNVRGARLYLQSINRQCICQGNTMFHVRNANDVRCFQPQEICNEKG